MLGLSPLGSIHAILGLVALGAGFLSLLRTGVLAPRSAAGRVYFGTTLLAALTALGIFRHGGPGPGHVLALLTFVALGVDLVAGRKRARRLFFVVENFSYSATLLFHLIPGVTETLTRFPADAPFASSAQDPVLRPLHLGLVVLFVVGVTLQARRHRSDEASNC